MAYFKDLQLIRYHEGCHDAVNWKSPLLAIGWLERPHEFPQGNCPNEVLLKISELRQQFRDAFPADSFRGLHDCSICEAPEDHLLESHINLFIPGDNVIFDVPGRIDHFIESHQYLPPIEFIEALLNCPDPNTEAYALALYISNGNCRPPLFPEKWRLFRLEEDGSHFFIVERDSEEAAQNLIKDLMTRNPMKTFVIKKAPEQWPGVIF